MPIGILRPMKNSSPHPRKSGILLHPTSLPGPHGIGDLGPGAHQFVQWLHTAEARIWQVLPLVPPGAGNSPYASRAALASNPLLISLELLFRDGLLDELPPPMPGSPDRVDFARVVEYKTPYLHQAARKVYHNPGMSADLEHFCQESPWVVDAALFQVLHHRLDRAWWDWDAPIRDRRPEALLAAQKSLADEMGLEVALQFLFDRQWMKLKQTANEMGIEILGDLPIYVDSDSVDTWVHRDQFLLDEHFRADPVAGVPPDYFSETGQLWGNPIYDWNRMASDGYSWWKSRMKRALTLFDQVRLDHFRGFCAYWAVPRDAEDARPGTWMPGPGAGFFSELKNEFGALPILAEDLGDIDEDVTDLRDGFSLPGMKILQFAFGGPAEHPFLPHNYPVHCAVYTGTHDNDTTLGWWRSVTREVQDHVRRYLAVDGHDICWDLIRCALFSVAHTAVFPFQDLLSLDSGARMNVPGIGENNWSWRVRMEAFNSGLAHRFRELVRLSGRAPAMVAPHSTDQVD